MHKEIEAKYLSINKEEVQRTLLAIGFKLKHAEHMMRRKTFDLPTQEGTRKWARVRQEAETITMAVKEIKGSSIHDVYEIELVVDDFEKACLFLEACGISAKSFQENMREVWSRDGVEVSIDTWPGLDPFIEIEAPEESLVKGVSKELGFDFSTATFGSIDSIYEKQLGLDASVVIQLPEITFASPPKK